MPMGIGRAQQLLLVSAFVAEQAQTESAQEGLVLLQTRAGVVLQRQDSGEPVSLAQEQASSNSNINPGQILQQVGSSVSTIYQNVWSDAGKNSSGAIAASISTLADAETETGTGNRSMPTSANGSLIVMEHSNGTRQFGASSSNSSAPSTSIASLKGAPAGNDTGSANLHMSSSAAERAASSTFPSSSAKSVTDNDAIVLVAGDTVSSLGANQSFINANESNTQQIKQNTSEGIWEATSSNITSISAATSSVLKGSTAMASSAGTGSPANNSTTSLAKVTLETVTQPLVVEQNRSSTEANGSSLVGNQGTEAANGSSVVNSSSAAQQLKKNETGGESKEAMSSNNTSTSTTPVQASSARNTLESIANSTANGHPVGGAEESNGSETAKPNSISQLNQNGTFAEDKDASSSNHILQPTTIAAINSSASATASNSNVSASASDSNASAISSDSPAEQSDGLIDGNASSDRSGRGELEDMKFAGEQTQSSAANNATEPKTLAAQNMSVSTNQTSQSASHISTDGNATQANVSAQLLNHALSSNSSPGKESDLTNLVDSVTANLRDSNSTDKLDNSSLINVSDAHAADATDSPEASEAKVSDLMLGNDTSLDDVVAALNWSESLVHEAANRSTETAAANQVESNETASSSLNKTAAKIMADSMTKVSTGSPHRSMGVFGNMVSAISSWMHREASPASVGNSSANAEKAVSKLPQATEALEIRIAHSATEFLQHVAQDCWQPCRQKSGYCGWCGIGNACCRSGWAGNAKECDRVTNYTTTKHECVVPVEPTFLRETGRMCGACDDSNDLHLGANGTKVDKATRKNALVVCGSKCSKNQECAGFNFVESLGGCYYRRAMRCQGSEAPGYDCYTKAANSSAANSTEAELLAMLAAKEATINKLEEELAKAREGSQGSDEEHEAPPELAMTQELSALSLRQESAKSNAGDVAALGQDGYAAVAGLGDAVSMESFIRRLATSLGYEVVHDSGLQGLAPFYMADRIQSFHALQAELTSVAQTAGSWLRPLAK